MSNNTPRSVASFSVHFSVDKYDDPNVRAAIVKKVDAALNYLRQASTTTDSQHKASLAFVKKDGTTYIRDCTVVQISDETMALFAPHIYGYPEDEDLLSRLRHYYSVPPEEREGLPKPHCIGYLAHKQGDTNGHFAIHVQEPIAVLSEI